MKSYREKWSVQQKRVTETVFRYHSVVMLQRVKSLKAAAMAKAGNGSTPATEKENSPPASLNSETVAEAQSQNLAALRKQEAALEAEMKELQAAKEVEMA